MHLSNLKILNIIANKKSTFIKTGIFSAIAACWGVILVGTTYVDYALPSGSTTATGRERLELLNNDVYCIGDHTMHPSVHGTLRSVERLLEHLEIPIPMKG